MSLLRAQQWDMNYFLTVKFGCIAGDVTSCVCLSWILSSGNTKNFRRIQRRAETVTFHCLQKREIICNLIKGHPKIIHTPLSSPTFAIRGGIYRKCDPLHLSDPSVISNQKGSCSELIFKTCVSFRICNAKGTLPVLYKPYEHKISFVKIYLAWGEYLK